MLKQHVIYYKDDNITGNVSTTTENVVDLSDIPEQDIVMENNKLNLDNIRTSEDVDMIRTILKIWKTPLEKCELLQPIENTLDNIKQYISDRS